MTASTAAAVTSSAAAGIPTATRVAGSPTQTAANSIRSQPSQCQTKTATTEATLIVTL